MADAFASPELVDTHLLVFPKPSPSPDDDLDSDADADLLSPPGSVDPEPHVSSQFYTFNASSHHLMVQCLLDNRYATPEEIRNATPANILVSWRGVWKDRNEETAYLTGWKRIQDKLHAQVDSEGNELLFFKNNPHQFVPHINQWQDIVQGFHGDADLRHLGLKETIDRIKQVWTVGAKFYGIPESYIRVCVASCPVCCSDVSVGQSRSKRRRFEYTDSFEVQAREVPQCLQQLAVKHQVVLCIRQKYIRSKPFLAEVKDYCCHRAGEPNAKKPGVLKRKRYMSKRCGCGFRIRTIVPITNYSDKEKTFTYLEEGQAVFKLYAVHSGHEPGPHEGSARIIHRFVGSSSLQMDSIPMFDPEEEEALEVVPKDEAEARNMTLQQVHELGMELRMVQEKLGNMSQDALTRLSQDLVAMTLKLRNVEELHKTEVVMTKHQADEVMLCHPGLGNWGEGQSRDKDESEHVGTEDQGYDPLGPDPDWQHKSLEGSSIRKGDKDARWMDTVKKSYSQHDAKDILAGESPKRCEAEDRQDGTVTGGAEVSLGGMPVVDNYYQENVKWYEGMSCALDPTADCADDMSHTVQAGFRHAIV